MSPLASGAEGSTPLSKGSWAAIPWLCAHVLDKKVVYGSSGISGTFYGAALLGSLKPMYLAWSLFFYTTHSS